MYKPKIHRRQVDVKSQHFTAYPISYKFYNGYRQLVKDTEQIELLKKQNKVKAAALEKALISMHLKNLPITVDKIDTLKDVHTVYLTFALLLIKAIYSSSRNLSLSLYYYFIANITVNVIADEFLFFSDRQIYRHISDGLKASDYIISYIRFTHSDQSEINKAFSADLQPHKAKLEDPDPPEYY